MLPAAELCSGRGDGRRTDRGCDRSLLRREDRLDLAHLLGVDDHLPQFVLGGEAKECRVRRQGEPFLLRRSGCQRLAQGRAGRTRIPASTMDRAGGHRSLPDRRPACSATVDAPITRSRRAIASACRCRAPRWPSRSVGGSVLAPGGRRDRVAGRPGGSRSRSGRVLRRIVGIGRRGTKLTRGPRGGHSCTLSRSPAPPS